MKFLITIVFMLSALVACTKKGNVDYDLPFDSTLRWNIATEPPTLDWGLATDSTSSRVLDNLMDGLVQYEFENSGVQTVPALATSWVSSADLKTWTFTMREGVKWSDGIPFTAQQVIDGWERQLNPKTGSEYGSFLFNIKNAKKYFQQEIQDFSEVGVHIDDQGRLVVELEHAQSYFPKILAHASTYPIRKDIILKYGQNWTEPAHFVGIGPFRLKIWDHDKALVLERDDNYYGEKAKLKFILCRIVNESSTALNMFKKGELDAVDDFPAIETENLRKTKEFRSVPMLAFNYFSFNVDKAPLNNANVRRAINLAIDRAEIVKVVGGDRVPAYGIIPPGLVGHDNTAGAQFDVAAANKAMDDAGYKDRSKFPKTTVVFNTNEDIQRMAENFQAQIKKNLNINLELQNQEWKAYNSLLKTGNFQIFRMAWVGDFPDPDAFASLFESNSEYNRGHYNNKEYDQLVSQALSEADDKKRHELYVRAQKIVSDSDPALVSFYYSKNHALVNKRIKNYPSNSMNRFIGNKIEIIK